MKKLLIFVGLLWIGLLLGCPNPAVTPDPPDPPVPTYTVTYNGNGATGGSVPTDSNNYLQGATVEVKGNTGGLSLAGYTFAGWNTMSDGSGTSYAGGATFPMGTADIALYTVWTTLPTYTVTYNGNGATGGSVPTDSNNYLQGATVEVKGNTGGLSLADYTFAGWNTMSAGSGTSYAGGATFPMGTANVILYAVWALIPTYTVTYDGNGADSGYVPTDGVHYAQGAPVPAFGNTGFLAKSDYSFAGWNTASDGSGITHAGGSLFSMGTANLTLFAVWVPSNLTFMSSGTSITITGYTTVSGSLTIPSGVTTIGNSAFYNCTSLTSVNIPSSVTSIGNSAFCLCSSLTSITIPSSVTTIGTNAFSACSSLTNITISFGVITIGDAAFSGCTGLTSITIPSSVTSIGNSAFHGCTGLDSVTISFGVTTIGDAAFSGCTGLTSITIPSSVTSIEDGTFSNCFALTNITLSFGVIIIGNSAFYSCISLTSVDIPSSVTTIGNSAFYNCTSLTSVNIPSSVTTIGNSAFYNCTSLTSVIVQATTPASLGSNVFMSCAAEMLIHVPSGTAADYFAADGWKDYASQIVSP
jgi:hypothetical protein